MVYTRYGHCHHLSVECLALAPTGKSYPILRQEMQDAFRPEHMRHEAECARVDFPCPSLEQGRGKTLHTFFLNDQKVKPHVHFLLNGQKKVNRKKSRRRCFIGRFFFYTNSVNLNILKKLLLLVIWIFHLDFLSRFKIPAGIRSSVVNFSFM